MVTGLIIITKTSQFIRKKMFFFIYKSKIINNNRIIDKLLKNKIKFLILQVM